VTRYFDTRFIGLGMTEEQSILEGNAVIASLGKIEIFVPRSNS